MSVAKAQEEISSKEFGEWQAYEAIDPGDPERSDLRAALISCTVANSMKGKKGRPFQVKDFLLKFETAERKTMQDVKMKLLAWKAAVNKRFAKKVEKK